MVTHPSTDPARPGLTFNRMQPGYPLRYPNTLGVMGIMKEYIVVIMF